MTSSLQRVGDYLIGKTLGVGSFGKVRLALHEPTGNRVAVKILNIEKLRSQGMQEKIKLEIKILKMCMHPHIIRLYEVIETLTDVYVIIEYSPGGELFDHIVERGRLPEGEARRFFQQIIAGVEYCHVHGVAHRDLKPENLLLDEHYNIKIADFGLSNRMLDGWFLKTSCGSPNYASPEIISGKLYAGNEVDVWSCGVILYALLCGSLPFDDENYQRLFQKIRRGLYLQPSYLSEDSKDLIALMLQTDPLMRITIADIRKHPWFLVDLPVYLSVPAERENAAEHLNEGALRRAVRMSAYSRQQITTALRQGRRNHYTVAYHLEKDAIEKRARLLLSSKLVQPSVSASSLPGGILPTGESGGGGSEVGRERATSVNNGTGPNPIDAAAAAPPEAASPTAASPTAACAQPEPGVAESQNVGSGQDAARSGTTADASANAAAEDIAVLNPTKADTMPGLADHMDYSPVLPVCYWIAGKTTPRSHPAELMTHVYRTLHRLNWRWKTPREKAYEIRVLVHRPEFSRPVRLSLQLFRTLSSFSLDFHRIDGEMIPYFAVCLDLIRELDF